MPKKKVDILFRFDLQFDEKVTVTKPGLKAYFEEKIKGLKVRALNLIQEKDKQVAEIATNFAAMYHLDEYILPISAPGVIPESDLTETISEKLLNNVKIMMTHMKTLKVTNELLVKQMMLLENEAKATNEMFAKLRAEVQSLRTNASAQQAQAAQQKEEGTETLKKIILQLNNDCTMLEKENKELKEKSKNIQYGENVLLDEINKLEKKLLASETLYAREKSDMDIKYKNYAMDMLERDEKIKELEQKLRSGISTKPSAPGNYAEDPLIIVEAKLKKFETKCKSDEEEIAELKAAISKKEEENKKLTADYAGALEELSQYEDSQLGKNLRKGKLSAQRAKTVQCKEALSQSLILNFGNLKDKVEKNDSQINRLLVEVFPKTKKRCEGIMAKSATLVQSLKEQVSQMEDIQKNLKLTNNSLNQQISALNSESSAKDAKNADIKAQVSDLDDRLKFSENQRKQCLQIMMSQFEEVKKKRGKCIEALKGFEAKAKGLETTAGNSAALLSKVLPAIKKATTSCKALKAEKDALKKTCQQLTERYKQQEGMIKESETALKSLTKQIIDKDKEKQQLDSLIASKKNELDGCSRKLQESEVAKKALEKKLEEYLSLNKTLKQKDTELASVQSELKKSISIHKYHMNRLEDLSGVFNTKYSVINLYVSDLESKWKDKMSKMVATFKGAISTLKARSLDAKAKALQTANAEREKIKKEADELKSQLSNLKMKNEALVSTTQRLTEKAEKHESTIAQKNNEVKKLSSEKQELQEKCHKFESAIKLLKQKTGEWKKSAESAKVLEMKILSEKIEKLQKTIELAASLKKVICNAKKTNSEGVKKLQGEIATGKKKSIEESESLGKKIKQLESEKLSIIREVPAKVLARINEEKSKILSGIQKGIAEKLIHAFEKQKHAVASIKVGYAARLKQLQEKQAKEIKEIKMRTKNILQEAAAKFTAKAINSSSSVVNSKLTAGIAHQLQALSSLVPSLGDKFLKLKQRLATASQSLAALQKDLQAAGLALASYKAASEKDVQRLKEQISLATEAEKTSANKIEALSKESQQQQNTIKELHLSLKNQAEECEILKKSASSTPSSNIAASGGKPTISSELLEHKLKAMVQLQEMRFKEVSDKLEKSLSQTKEASSKAAGWKKACSQALKVEREKAKVSLLQIKELTEKNAALENKCQQSLQDGQAKLEAGVKKLTEEHKRQLADSESKAKTAAGELLKAQAEERKEWRARLLKFASQRVTPLIEALKHMSKEICQPMRDAIADIRDKACRAPLQKLVLRHQQLMESQLQQAKVQIEKSKQVMEKAHQIQIDAVREKLKAEVKQITAEKSALQQEYETLKKALSEKQHQIAELPKQHEAQLKALQTQIQSLQNENQKLSTVSASSKNDTDKKTEALVAKIASLEQDKKAMEQDLKKLMMNHNTLQESNLRLQESKDIVMKELRDSMAELDNAKKTAENLKKAHKVVIGKMKQGMEKVSKEVGALKSQVTALHNALREHPNIAKKGLEETKGKLLVSLRAHSHKPISAQSVTSPPPEQQLAHSTSVIVSGPDDRIKYLKEILYLCKTLSKSENDKMDGIKGKMDKLNELIKLHNEMVDPKVAKDSSKLKNCFTKAYNYFPYLKTFDPKNDAKHLNLFITKAIESKQAKGDKYKSDFEHCKTQKEIADSNRNSYEKKLAEIQKKIANRGDNGGFVVARDNY